jgi:hypothetical protein
MKKLEITPAVKRMRGKVIHYLCLMGMVKEDGTADYDRINAFVKHLGSNNPRGVILNFLYERELPAVVTQIEKMYAAELRRAGEDAKMKERVKGAAAEAARELGI